MPRVNESLQFDGTQISRPLRDVVPVAFFIAAFVAVSVSATASTADAKSTRASAGKAASDISVSGQQLRGGPDPALVLDLSVVVLEGGGWTTEAAKEHLKKVDAIFGKCGFGLGTVQIRRLQNPRRAFVDRGLKCSRYRTKQEPEYRCLGGPGDPAMDKSIQGLAQRTADLRRPTLHLIDQLEGPNPGVAYSSHTDQGEQKFWTSRKELKSPVTTEEERHLKFFNHVLGTAFVSHGISEQNVTGPSAIGDAEISVRIAHELGHLLGSPHDDSEPPTIMNEAPGTTQDVNEGLCKKLHASPLLVPAHGASGAATRSAN